jgi:hypothetical protein
MTCSACGATLPDEAQFCEECGRPVASQPASSAPAPYQEPPTRLPYGAIEGRPTGRTFTFTLAGIALLALVVAGGWYYKVAEDRRLTELDHPALSAELDALSAAAQPLERLAVAATPETKPEDFAKLLDEAKAAVARYHEQSKLDTALPSGRQWPGQFHRASAYLDESIKFFPGVGMYLKQRSEIKDTKPSATVDVDQNILNVSGIAGEPLAKLTTTLEEMDRQRAGVSWVYEPKPKGAVR